MAKIVEEFLKKINEDDNAYYYDALGNASSNTKVDIPALDEVTEAKRQSTSRTTAKTKIARATSQLASIEARKKNDSDYKMMKFHQEKYRYYLDKIHKKYGSRVKQKARN
jgi:hypothetical protein